MTFKHPRFANAVSLTEVVVAMAILAIATLGGLGYQYFAARHSRIARAEIIGARTAQLLLEDWKSIDGSSTYDPSALGLGFSTLTPFSSVAGNTDTALYSIDRPYADVPMRVTLQWVDRPADPYYSDPITGVKLREISVTVRFIGASEDADGSEYIQPVILTTYVRINP